MSPSMKFGVTCIDRYLHCLKDIYTMTLLQTNPELIKQKLSYRNYILDILFIARALISMRNFHTFEIL